MKIKIKQSVFNQMLAYARYAEEHFGSEVAGWAHYSKGEGIYKLAPLTEQTVSSAEVDAFPNDILNEVDYDISDMIVQWHSHANMKTLFSGTDVSNINDILPLLKVVISIVVNVKGEYAARLDMLVENDLTERYGLTNNHITETVELEVVPDYPELENEILEKLTKVVQRPAWNRGYGYGGSGFYNHGGRVIPVQGDDDEDELFDVKTHVAWKDKKKRNEDEKENEKDEDSLWADRWYYGY